jgi:hypothetical protein
MEDALNLTQPALIAAADHLLDLVDQVLDRYSNNTQSRCWTGLASESCRRSLIPCYSEADQQTSLHQGFTAAAYS